MIFNAMQDKTLPTYLGNSKVSYVYSTFAKLFQNLFDLSHSQFHVDIKL